MFLPKFACEILNRVILHFSDVQPEAKQNAVLWTLFLSTRMELYRDILEIFAPFFLRYSIRSQMPLDTHLWKTSTGQKRLSFFGQKIWSRINLNNKNVKQHLLLCYNKFITSWTICLSGLRFKWYFSHQWPDDGRSISRSVAHLNILVHDVINLLYYEYWTDKQKYFYVYLLLCILF